MPRRRCDFLYWRFTYLRSGSCSAGALVPPPVRADQAESADSCAIAAQVPDRHQLVSRYCDPDLTSCCRADDPGPVGSDGQRHPKGDRKQLAGGQDLGRTHHDEPHPGGVSGPQGVRCIREDQIST
jgi:hypothetical protein